jgi:hypothetical protein
LTIQNEMNAIEEAALLNTRSSWNPLYLYSNLKDKLSYHDEAYQLLKTHML